MDRKSKIRELLALTPDDVITRAGKRLVVCGTLDALHRRFAEDIAGAIAEAAEESRPAHLILPVGPCGQYPYLLELIEERQLSLTHCWLFFMDEYCDEAGHALPPSHPLSLRGEAERVFLGKLPAAIRPPQSHIIFPNETNINSIEQQIDDAGGIDVCFGGIGIHGHIAFNEPAPGVAHTGPRRVRLNDFTITMNTIRANVGGNLACFPRQAYTLGMRQILGARRIRLYCRNGVALDWANTVLRLALFGTPGDDFPVTHIRGKSFVITTDLNTLASPQNAI